jgi:membrane associated rhomboid family serine protease
VEETASATPLTAEGSLRQRQQQPWLTWLACAVCAFLFIRIHVESSQDYQVVLARWGWRPPDDIYSGAYWALITSVFIHVDLWHLVFNLYWLYHLGRRLEQVIGSWRWLGFLVGAAITSSGMELAASGDTGIGASGVGYALFGFMWVTRKRVPMFAEVLDQRTVIIFLIWLVVCVVLTESNVWSVGNAAHFAGLLYGIALAAWLLFKPRRLLIAIGIVVLVLAGILPLFWAPWSISWTSWRAGRAYMEEDFPAAIAWYERSLKLGQDKVWCLHSIALARGCMGDETAYQNALETLRKVDATAAKDVEEQFQEPGR